MGEVGREARSALEGYLAELGEAELELQVALEEALQVYLEPSTAEARLQAGGAIVDVPIARPEPVVQECADGSIHVSYAHSGRRYVLVHEDRWRIAAIEEACLCCAGSGCERCAGSGWLECL